MPSKVVRLGSILDTELACGIEIVADLVATTLGPAGRATMAGRTYANSVLLRDGYAVVQELEFSGSGRQIGLHAMRDLAWRTIDQVGDGASTAIVMAREFIRSGARMRSLGFAPAAVQDAMSRHCCAIIAELEAAAVPATSPGQLLQVASQAAHGDAGIAQLIVGAHGDAGPDGVVAVEPGHGRGDELDVRLGMHVESGWMSPHFVVDQRTQSVTLNNPLILLHLEHVHDVGSIVPVLEMMAKAGRALVIIAGGLGSEALATLVANRRAGFKVAVVKAPGVGPWRAAMLDDIAAATGGTVIAPSTGTSLAHVRPLMLGRAKEVQVGRTGTTIVGGHADPVLLANRIYEIRDALRRERYLSYDRDQHRRRLARLAAGIATVRLGGTTDLEIADRVSKARAASAAVGQAQAGGLLPGASSALIHAGRRARGALTDDLLGQLVGQVFEAALQAPLRAALVNAGLDARSILTRVAENDGLCFDIATRIFERDTALFDPLPVMKAALRNSVSVASRLLGVEAIILSRVA